MNSRTRVPLLASEFHGSSLRRRGLHVKESASALARAHQYWCSRADSAQSWQSLTSDFSYLPKPRGRLIAVGALGLIGFLPATFGQAVVNVAGATSQFQSWKLSSGAAILDTSNDAQGGIMAGDFLGLAAGATGFSVTPASAVPSSMVAAGTIGGVNHLVFRYRMTDYNGNKIYVGSAISVGIGFRELSGPGVTTI